jgi:hypothetical protein
MGGRIPSRGAEVIGEGRQKESEHLHFSLQGRNGIPSGLQVSLASDCAELQGALISSFGGNVASGRFGQARTSLDGMQITPRSSVSHIGQQGWPRRLREADNFREKLHVASHALQRLTYIEHFGLVFQ